MTTSPDTRLSTPKALLRLLEFARPVLPRLFAGGLSALAAALIALMIPIALEWLIEGPIASGEVSAVAWGAIAVLVLGLLEATMVYLRRWLILGPATLVEYDIRRTFFNRLQHLPVSFHDRWQSGQLLSRMMQDIGLIRRWMAFGLVLLVVNILTIIIGAILLFQWHWALALVFLVSGVPLCSTSSTSNVPLSCMPLPSQPRARASSAPLAGMPMRPSLSSMTRSSWSASPPRASVRVSDTRRASTFLEMSRPSTTSVNVGARCNWLVLR